MKRLYRTHKNSPERMIAGVCGGLAHHFDTDPNLVRIVTVLAFLVTGLIPVGLTYIVAWIIFPEEDSM